MVPPDAAATDPSATSGTNAMIVMTASLRIVRPPFYEELHHGHAMEAVCCTLLVLRPERG